MPELRGDQAEGLRRLLCRPDTQIIRLASGCSGVGKTSVALNIAAELSLRGARVLLIDENRGPSNVSSCLGLRSQYSLENIAHNECTLDHALVSAEHGMKVLLAAGVASRFPVWSTAARSRLNVALCSVREQFDLVLLDTSCDTEDTADLFASSVGDTIVVSSTEKHAVMSSYALIKRLRGVGRQDRFHFLLNQVATEEIAVAILRNVVDVASGHLQTSVASLGAVPADKCLSAARPGCQFVVNSHPTSPSAVRLRHIADSILDWRSRFVLPDPVNQFMRRVLADRSSIITPSGA